MLRDFRGFPSPRRENAPINLSYAVERLRRHAGYIIALSSVRNLLEVIVVLKCCQMCTFHASTGLVPVGLIFPNSLLLKSTLGLCPSHFLVAFLESLENQPMHIG